MATKLDFVVWNVFQPLETAELQIGDDVGHGDVGLFEGEDLITGLFDEQHRGKPNILVFNPFLGTYEKLLSVPDNASNMQVLKAVDDYYSQVDGGNMEWDFYGFRALGDAWVIDLRPVDVNRRSPIKASSASPRALRVLARSLRR